MLDRNYYPKNCNPIHEVRSWSYVRKIVRAVRHGEDIPPYLMDGETLLSGTHRAAANDLLEMLDDDRRVESIQLGELPESLQDKINDDVSRDDYEDIDSYLDEFFKNQKGRKNDYYS